MHKTKCPMCHLDIEVDDRKGVVVPITLCLNNSGYNLYHTIYEKVCNDCYEKYYKKTP